MTRPSDRAYAQAVRELENWPPGDQLSGQSAAVWITRRAREIDAAAPEGAQVTYCDLNGCVHKQFGCPTWPAGTNPFSAECAQGAVALPPIVKEVLEWYASDPTVWVAWNDEGWAEEDRAKKSGHYTFIGEDSRGHNQYMPNWVRAEEALAALKEWEENATPPQDAARDREDAELQQLSVLYDIRKAIGDDGKLMQDELVAVIAKLAKEAERYRWLRDTPAIKTYIRGFAGDSRISGVFADVEIDAARGAGGGGDG